MLLTEKLGANIASTVNYGANLDMIGLYPVKDDMRLKPEAPQAFG